MFFTNLLEANMRIKNFQFDMTYYPRTESTNKDIWEIYNITKKDDLFVITDNQINGKGRGEKTWLSTPNKSITCSFLLKQIFRLSIQPLRHQQKGNQDKFFFFDHFFALLFLSYNST